MIIHLFTTVQECHRQLAPILSIHPWSYMYISNFYPHLPYQCSLCWARLISNSKFGRQQFIKKKNTFGVISSEPNFRCCNGDKRGRIDDLIFIPFYEYDEFDYCRNLLISVIISNEIVTCIFFNERLQFFIFQLSYWISMSFVQVKIVFHECLLMEYVHYQPIQVNFEPNSYWKKLFKYSSQKWHFWLFNSSTSSWDNQINHTTYEYWNIDLWRHI